MGLPSPTTAKLKSRPVNFPLPSKLKKFLNTIIEDLTSIRVRSGTNTAIRQFTDSTEVSAIVPKAQRPLETRWPFQVVRVHNPDPMSNVPLVGVVSDSHLANSEDKDTYEEDNSDWGLLDDGETGTVGVISTDELNIGDKIWLAIELDDNQAIVSIDIEWGLVGSGSWDTWPNPIEINDDDDADVFQQFYHQIIAEVTDPAQDPREGLIITKADSSPIQITQCLLTDLMMTTAHTTMDALYPQLPLLVAVPWHWRPGTNNDGSADEINLVPIPDDGDDPMTPWQFGDATRAQSPFQVIPTLQNGDEAIGVISNSHLFNSEDRTVYEEPNDDWGLLLDDESANYFDCPSVGSKIWLEIQLDPDDQSIVSISVQSGTSWEGYPDPIDINQDDPSNPYQQFWRQIIAEVTDPSQDPRPGFVVGDKQVTQLLFGNLQMTTAKTTSDADQPGLPLLVAVPIPWLPGTADDGSADEIPPEDGLITPWQFGDQNAENHYDFEMVDASTIDDGAQILIYDGVVFSPNNDDEDGVFDPDGMPSDNSYFLNVEDGDEVWLEIDWDLEEDDGVSGDNIVSCSINNGPSTPDDIDLTQYITIGHVEVDDSGDVPIVSCFNEVCGDVVIQYPPDLSDGVDQHKLVTDPDTGNKVWKADIPDPPASGRYVLVSIDGDVQWVAGTDC